MAENDSEPDLSTPADSDLWGLVRAAVEVTAAAAEAHLEGGGYRPRRAMPTVGAFNSGWPNIDSNRLYAPKDAPTQVSALFGSEVGTLKPFAYQAFPELSALIAYVRDTERLRACATIPSATAEAEIQERMLEFEAMALPMSILDRARATGATTETALFDLYLQRERAWLQDPLPVEYIIPLALTALDLDAPLALDDSTRIEPLDESTQAARAPREISVASVPAPVISAATHAIVITGHSIPNPGPGPRLFGRDPDHEPPLDAADLVCQALRIVSHTDVGYAQVLRRPVGWADNWHHDLPAMTTITTVRRYPEHFDNFGWLKQPNPIDAATLRQLPKVLTSLKGAPSNVRLAARRLSLAAMRDIDEDRTVDACIGLEALLGEGRDELSHRMSLRAAVALATRAEDPADAETVYKLMKKVYDHRSAVVHSNTATKSQTVTINDQKISAADASVLLLREILVDALTRTPSWTAKSLDADLLAALQPAPPVPTLPDDDVADAALVELGPES